MGFLPFKTTTRCSRADFLQYLNRIPAASKIMALQRILPTCHPRKEKQNKSSFLPLQPFFAARCVWLVPSKILLNKFPPHSNCKIIKYFEPTNRASSRVLELLRQDKWHSPIQVSVTSSLSNILACIPGIVLTSAGYPCL